MFQHILGGEADHVSSFLQAQKSTLLPQVSQFSPTEDSSPEFYPLGFPEIEGEEQPPPMGCFPSEDSGICFSDKPSPPDYGCYSSLAGGPLWSPTTACCQRSFRHAVGEEVWFSGCFQ